MSAEQLLTSPFHDGNPRVGPSQPRAAKKGSINWRRGAASEKAGAAYWSTLRWKSSTSWTISAGAGLGASRCGG
jgi:hypothetical protein